METSNNNCTDISLPPIQEKQHTLLNQTQNKITNISLPPANKLKHFQQKKKSQQRKAVYGLRTGDDQAVPAKDIFYQSKNKYQNLSNSFQYAPANKINKQLETLTESNQSLQSSQLKSVHRVPRFVKLSTAKQILDSLYLKCNFDQGKQLSTESTIRHKQKLMHNNIESLNKESQQFPNDSLNDFSAYLEEQIGSTQSNNQSFNNIDRKFQSLDSQKGKQEANPSLNEQKFKSIGNQKVISFNESNGFSKKTSFQAKRKSHHQEIKLDFHTFESDRNKISLHSTKNLSYSKHNNLTNQVSNQNIPKQINQSYNTRAVSTKDLFENKKNKPNQIFNNQSKALTTQNKSKRDQHKIENISSQSENLKLPPKERQDENQTLKTSNSSKKQIAIEQNQTEQTQSVIQTIPTTPVYSGDENKQNKIDLLNNSQEMQTIAEKKLQKKQKKKQKPYKIKIDFNKYVDFKKIFNQKQLKNICEEKKNFKIKHHQLVWNPQKDKMKKVFGNKWHDPFVVSSVQNISHIFNLEKIDQSFKNNQKYKKQQINKINSKVNEKILSMSHVYMRFKENCIDMKEVLTALDTLGNESSKIEEIMKSIKFLKAIYLQANNY